MKIKGIVFETEAERNDLRDVFLTHSKFATF
jgi:hypothetical protein